jgi:hypothetical protein
MSHLISSSCLERTAVSIKTCLSSIPKASVLTGTQTSNKSCFVKNIPPMGYCTIKDTLNDRPLKKSLIYLKSLIKQAFQVVFTMNPQGIHRVESFFFERHAIFSWS